MCPRKRTMKQQPVNSLPLLTRLPTLRPTAEAGKPAKGEQTELLDLRELEFNLLGITARNCAGITTVEGVTGYLLVGVKRTTDDLRKTQHPTSPWKQPLGGMAYRKWTL